MSNGQDAQWSRMTLRAHTNAWLHRHEDLDMASRTRNGPGDWNNPRDMENIPRVTTDTLPAARHSTSLPPPPPCPTRARPSPDGLTRRGFDYAGDKGMCGSRPPLERMAFVLSFSTATDGASATYPNGASDSDAWARVPEIGIHPERVSRGGRGKGLAARGVRRGQRELAIGNPPLAELRLLMPVPSGTRGPQNAARPRSATDTIGCPRLIRSYSRARMYTTGGTRRWRDGVAVRPRRPGHDPALARCAWERTLAEGDTSFAERE
ncbi:hypothetical protein GGG16DRAFT_86474, partial [Schizophyllum commune]